MAAQSSVVVIKAGVIKDDELEELSEKLGNSWKPLARRLGFNMSEITGFHKAKEESTEKALSMLKKWKEKVGSGATYWEMYVGLCHEYVTRRDLAEEICCQDSPVSHENGTKPSQMLETGSPTQGPSEKGTSGPPEVSVTLLKLKNLPRNALSWHTVQLPIDFLLLTVEPCELLSCLSYLNEGFFRSYHKSLGFVYFGDIGEDETMRSKIAVICGFIVVTVTKAVTILRPKAVFCVGFCGGLNYRKVNLGDVVVSARLITYAPTKITDSGVRERGVRVPINKRIAGLIKSAGEGWQAPLKDPGQLEVEVHCDGEFLSGPEVVDSKERRDQLINRFPDAIAFEMDAEGYYTLLHDLDIDWIIIKGISDLADGRVSERDFWRSFASLMAALLTAHMLRDSTVFKEWPHYQDYIPAYVLARGIKALEAYQRALDSGRTYDKRVKVLLVGQDRVGKTSLGKCLRGEPFNKDEPSTDVVQMIPAIKNAGIEAWKNPASLENTAVFDHKIAAKIAEEFLNTPKQYELKTKEGKSEETAGNLSKEDRETTRQEDMKRNEKESDEKQTEPQREEKEDAMPVEVVSLLEERLQENKIDEDDRIWPIIWDFAGQDIYRAIHPIFMSSEDIYLLVFDLTKELGLIAECRVNQGDGEHAVPARESKDSNLDHMMRWMDLIHSLKNCEGIETSSPELSLPPVIVVGTHADELEEEDPRKKIELAKTKWERVREAFPGHFTTHIKNFLPMDNTKAGEATGQEEIITLRREILDLAYEMPHTMKEIPLQWHLLEKEIGKPIWQDREEPFLPRKAFQEEIVSRFCKADNEDDFDELLHFLHARGSIVYHEHLDENTGDKNGLVFLNPQWLINILCQIIKVESCKDEPEIIKQDRKTLQSKGILSNRLLDRACRKLKLESIKHSLLSLMKKFNLICEWSTTKPEDSLIFVPCMLTTTSEEGDTAHEGTSDSLAPVYLTFDGTNYVPGGLFSRLVVLFGEWLSDPQCRNEYELHANEATYALDEDHFLHLVCYKTIIKLRISAEGDAAPSDYLKNVLRHLMDFLKTLREECHWLHSMMAKLCARCTACAGKSDKNTTPCIRHGKPACRHYDCAHYIPLNSRVLCCRPGCPVLQKPLMPWIQALKSLHLTNNPGASAESSLKRPSTTTEIQQQSKRPRTMTETNSVKAGKVSDKDLQLLSGKLVGDKWKKLGRRLEVDEAKISAYNKQHEELDEKAYHMLRDWKERKGSGATYEVLYDALCDEERVACRNLAEEICCVQSS